ncbi:MAG: DNA polymerase III subunit alpha [Desulfovibrionaceae bacterium CG1_02_65_16]|nr:MAG: DNA polymerase III subunit alpha [Desulfovibrionaceae bacterium CG1_02_65_16]
MSDFVHLHCHSEYSLLDGAIRIKDLCARAKDLGMPAVALTDHGNMHGALVFRQQAIATGIRPIIGCEVYVAPGDRTDKKATSSRQAAYHLVLLAQNHQGYQNLIKLVSEGFLTGFHYKPRVDKNLLRQYSEGLIALSACLAGEVNRTLLGQGLDAGIAMAKEYAEIFPDRYYLELQENGIADQTRANQMLLQVAAETKLPLVATNDCHYLTQSDAEAHDILLCIGTQRTVLDKDRMRMDTTELFFKTMEEMEAAFDYCPQAIENTLKIAEQCDVTLDLGNHYFPVYELPEGMSIEAEFERMAHDGLKKRLESITYKVDEQKYWDRLEYEIGVIKEMGFPAYFLIVQDFINWAKRERIPVGPGRGSAAGSLVAWALKITNLDPLPYDLLFERFLNIERISMPDIDVDFCERRRLEVVAYVARKYGRNHVAQITTFGTMKAKAAIRDVGRALGMTFAETDRIAKLIPEEMKMTIAKALEKEPELQAMAVGNPQIEKLLDVSQRLEGLARHVSTHAAGIVISEKPMLDYLPLYKGKEGEIVTQFDGKFVEKVGLIKFDFLGLRTMTVIEDALDIIRRGGKTPPDLDNLELTDPATYEIFCAGDTDGIFQVESSGMRKYLRMLKPSCFEDIIAMLALYRPGPLGSGMVDEFIKRKQGQIPVTYPHPSLEETLKPTYGVIVYQEQVMSCARVIANYTLGGADLLRRAMGKKKAEEMAKERQKFMAGARENNIAEATAQEIFDLMEKFAEYGFNKSHSAAYALISYYTAFLKAHFPHEFMAALISSELTNTDKVFTYINACREMQIPVVPPDVNVSETRFCVIDNKVVFGLAGIKGVGEDAVDAIVAERQESGPFRDIYDLCERVNLRKINKRTLEALIKAGGLDCLGKTRAGLMAVLERAVSMGQKKAKEKAQGMISMLDMLGGKKAEGEAPAPLIVDEDVPEWHDEEKMRLEKEALGFFLSSHPLLRYRHELKRMNLNTLAELKELPGGMIVRVAALVTSLREYINKKGDKMAFLQLEDLTGTGECTLFSNVYLEARELLGQDQPLVFEGKVDVRTRPGEEEGPRESKMLADSVKLLTDCAAQCREPARIPALEEHCAEARLDALKNVLASHPGAVPVMLDLHLPEATCVLKLGEKYKVAACPEFWADVEKWRQAG